MSRRFDIRSSHEKQADAASIGILHAQAILRGPVDSGGNVVELAAKTFGAGSRITRAVQKAAVEPITSTDNPLMRPALSEGISEDFVDGIRSQNSLDASSAAMVPIAPNSAVRVAVGVALGTLNAEGALKPVRALGFGLEAPPMQKVTTIVVVDDAVLRGRNAERIIGAALGGGVAIGTGGAFLAMLQTGVTPIAATGTDAAAFAADLSAALSQIRVGAGSRIYAAASPELLKRLALLTTTSGERAFPELTIYGGDVGGVQFVPDDSIGVDTSGSLITVYDASRIALADQGVDVRASKQATLQMDDTPTNPPTASTVMVSMFQTNRVAILAERWIGFSKLTSDCCAVISGVNYAAS